MSRYIDIACRQDEDGIFDLIIDEDTRDLEVGEGLESALITSLFSDRRAARDEVANPLKRRGWIGNLVAEVPGDNFGSGLWLYEQKRLEGEVATGLRSEAEQSLDWLVEENLLTSVSAQVIMSPEKRGVFLMIHLTSNSGDATSMAYRLADATQRGILAQLGTFPGLVTDPREDMMLWGDEKIDWGLGNTLEWD